MRRRTRAGAYRGKRGLDLLLLLPFSVPAALVAAVCALAVRRSSPGPVLFRQERIGRGGRPFEVLKFRTMVVEAAERPGFPEEELITPTGRWLRRFSLDELPQLVNVLRGDMSLVGPRPTLAYQVERYDDRQRGRLAVRPGITGLAQVRGRNAITWGERIEHDLEYVERQSLLLDLAILARSLLGVIRGGGVEGHPMDDPLAVAPARDGG